MTDQDKDDYREERKQERVKEKRPKKEAMSFVIVVNVIVVKIKFLINFFNSLKVSNEKRTQDQDQDVKPRVTML